MNNIFRMELSNGKDNSFDLSLPATDYELLDALDRLHMSPGEKPDWEIIESGEFYYLEPFLTKWNLYEINDLTRRLGGMDQRQLAAFEGLLEIAPHKQEGPVSVIDLFTYANSVDCCHVVSEATDDAKLGRFYAENDFIPDLVDIPDSVFEKLDFEKIGKEMRKADGGVFTPHGYVMQHEKLIPYTEPVGTFPQAPNYVFRLGLYHFMDTSRSNRLATLDVPASPDQIPKALKQCGVRHWAEIEYRIEDSAIPYRTASMEQGDIFQINELAQAVKHRQEQGELPKLKAVFHALDYLDIATAADIVEDLDVYLYESDKRTAVDIARARLRSIVGEHDLPLLLERVNLYGYGLDLMEAEKITMTPYGAVTCQDDEMLLAPEDRPRQGGMEMQ